VLYNHLRIFSSPHGNFRFGSEKRKPASGWWITPFLPIRLAAIIAQIAKAGNFAQG
jgi:hypothetical protein